MGLKLSQIGSNRVPVEVEFEGGTLTVQFNPRKLTTPFLDRLGEVGEEEWYGEDGVIVGWDLLDDQGEVIPLTPEGLAEVPMFVRRAITSAVLGAPVPNGKTPS
jgi:hypothetical protein